LIFDLLFRAII